MIKVALGIAIGRACKESQTILLLANAIMFVLALAELKRERVYLLC